MSKMHYFSTKFSKFAKRLHPTALVNFRLWWLAITWLGQIAVFQTDYDKIEFEKIRHDIISVASS